jgi:hypothetical protein
MTTKQPFLWIRNFNELDTQFRLNSTNKFCTKPVSRGFVSNYLNTTFKSRQQKRGAVDLKIIYKNKQNVLKSDIRGCIQTFPDWVDKEIYANNKHSLRSNTKGYGDKTHKIAIRLHLVAESCTICSFRSRRPVRQLLDTPPYCSYL